MTNEVEPKAPRADSSAVPLDRRDSGIVERPGNLYRFGTAEFDEARFELRVAGLPVDVELRALEVLAYLLRHAGEVVTKEELLREVWAGRITVEKVLPNAINKLRRALGESNGELIVTQARIGYRLEGVTLRQTQARQIQSMLALKAGQSMPMRENFVLKEQLSSRSGIEVWLAEHAKTHQKRVYKLCAETESRRALKREATLSRVLQESLEERGSFVDIIDWNFETAPYFLESDYAGVNLAQWSKTELEALNQTQRIELFLQICDAVAAAHSVGVLHKDLKPANILLAATDKLDWQARLSDFGSGRLLDPDQLARLGITQMSQTVNQNISEDNSSGTPMYIAPEVFAGQVPTAQNDVYALGILLYQLLCGQLNRPMAPGWEQDIADECLREDLQLATDGNPLRRLASATALSARLRDHDSRRKRSRELLASELEGVRTREALAKAQARRPYVIGLVMALGIGAMIAAWFAYSAMQARNQANVQLARANAINDFLSSDLISRSNPVVLAQGADATIRDVLLSTRDRLASRFAGQPETEASIRNSMSELFNTIDLWPESVEQANAALKLLESNGGDKAIQKPEIIRVRANLVRILSRMSKFDEANQQLEALKLLVNDASSATDQFSLQAAWGTHLLIRMEMKASIVPLTRAIELAKQPELAAKFMGSVDSLKLDLIFALTMTERSAEAQSLGLAQLKTLRERSGDHTLMSALTKTAMARSYSYQQNNEQAEKLLREAQPIVIQRLGETNARSINLQSELMAIAFRRADWPLAQVEAEKVYRAVAAKLGPEHGQTAISLANWGRTYFEAGRAAEAAPHVRAAYEQLVRDQSAKAPPAQDAAYLLVTIELELGQLDAAERLMATLDPKILESFRSHGLWQAGCDGLRGLLLHAHGKFDEARPLLVSSLAALKPETPEEPEDRGYVLMKNALSSIDGLSKSRRAGDTEDKSRRAGDTEDKSRRAGDTEDKSRRTGDTTGE
jgi:eukaryotic-like serine/threonine-protein kinase